MAGIRTCDRESLVLASADTLQLGQLVTVGLKDRCHILVCGITFTFYIVIVPEKVLVLFQARTTSLRTGLGTFFVPESDHAKHFHQIYSISIDQNCLLCKVYEQLYNFCLT